VRDIIDIWIEIIPVKFSQIYNKIKDPTLSVQPSDHGWLDDEICLKLPEQTSMSNDLEPRIQQLESDVSQCIQESHQLQISYLEDLGSAHSTGPKSRARKE
jgi:hypothetical protein